MVTEGFLKGCSCQVITAITFVLFFSFLFCIYKMVTEKFNLERLSRDALIKEILTFLKEKKKGFFFKDL